MTNESKDIQYTKLVNRAAELHRDFMLELDNLRALADDFTAGSQQRFVLALREASALRDQLWSVRQKLNELDQE